MIKENYKTALVVGAGKSGIAAANLLSERGLAVYLSDRKKKSEIDISGVNQAVKFITEDKLEGILHKADFVVKSPGISNDAPVLAIIKKAGLPVFSEIETALHFSRSPNIIMITGTNGKTTTACMIHSILKIHAARKGRKSFFCGNTGIPACEQAPMAREKDYIVMEISSYQLEDSSFLKPRISVILNITPDHLEHHGSMSSYIKAKASIFSLQDKNDFCILNYEDKYLRKLAKKCPARVLFFSSRNKGRKVNAFLENGNIKLRIGGQSLLLSPPPIPGIHNIENTMAAALTVALLGVDRAIMQRTFDTFGGIEHRIESVRELRGVRYINDSKSTNVDSTVTALKALGADKNIWLILGGLDKGASYRPLIPLIKKFVKKILTIGSAAGRIYEELKNCAPIENTVTMKKALLTIKDSAKSGDIALLSPACASYDQFMDFEDRGRQFKKIVRTFR